MEDQKSLSSIPLKWEKRYLLKRIGEKDIELTLKERNAILENLMQGKSFVQLGEFTLMLNSIKSIDPFYPPFNIPPRPAEKIEFIDERATTINQEEMEEWDKYFGKERGNASGFLE